MRSPSLLLIVALSGVLAACGDAPSDTDARDQSPHSEDEHVEDADEHGDDEHGDDEHDDAPASTTIPATVARESGIEVTPAAPGVIADEHEVQGLLTPIDGALANVMARFPGPIRALDANVGDAVKRGQRLALIESNLSLSTYAVTAPISGVVLRRDATVGSIASEGSTLFEVADLSRLWVDLHIFGSDAQHITAGAPVRVTRMGDGVSVDTTLERILPSTATVSQSTVARARIDNTDGLWRPGTAVKARITVDLADVPIAIPQTALQNDGEREVVFVRRGETYVTRPVKLGRRDARRVEVVEGLAIGEEVVTAQSFLIKADIEKSTAEHEH